MTPEVKKDDSKQPTLSEKALRLLAAHDREIKSFENILNSEHAAIRYG
jgi:hypothetical protein